jgi:hypothetical protein
MVKENRKDRRRSSRAVATALFAVTWLPLSLAWAFWDGFESFFARPADLELIVIFSPVGFALLCVWDMFVERHEAQRTGQNEINTVL